MLYLPVPKLLGQPRVTFRLRLIGRKVSAILRADRHVLLCVNESKLEP